jgi:peptidoglycan/xylan/chitin deacetylase (PgdA/CDA1 family)
MNGFGLRIEPLLLAAALAFALVLSASPAPQSVVLPTTEVNGTVPAAQHDETPADAMRVAPYLQVVRPDGDEVGVTSPIVLTFNQRMSRLSVERTFAITPKVAGTLTWLDDSRLRFQPVRLHHGVTYEVRVGGRSLAGVMLKGPSSWQFSTETGPPTSLAPGPALINVPILMYHYIQVNHDFRDRLGFALSVTPDDFEAQMDWLARNGYHAAGLPSHPVILTFDDGYADFYTQALPVLLSHDFRAVIYIVSGFIGRPGYMTASQILMADSADIEVGSHTVEHADLAAAAPARVRYQLAESKQALERLLGHPVLSFCYPSGKFNPAVASAVESAGYRDATTTRLGSVRTLGGRYVWGRLRISGGESLAVFAADVMRLS